MKCNQSRPGFELVSPCSFPRTITITPQAPPPLLLFTGYFINFFLRCGFHFSLLLLIIFHVNFILPSLRILSISFTCNIRYTHNSPIILPIYIYILSTWKLLGFKSTIHTNLKTVNFLDITLNLTNCTYEPYKKDNNTPIYIHTSSNHPPSITKQIRKSISRRLSSNSSNTNIFNKHLYDDALKHSGYKQELKFTPTKVNSKHRSRNIIWFNPTL